MDSSPTQLKATILSHGWYSLMPFLACIKPPKITVPFDLPGGSGSFSVYVVDGKTHFSVVAGEEQFCRSVANNCLSLEVNTKTFYKNIKDSNPSFGWITRKKMGRFLKSPSLFEDCCKGILTTNTTWDRTTQMASRLVEKLGSNIGNFKAFPTPSKIVECSEEFLRSEIGCGFRAKYIIGLAQATMHNKVLFLDNGWMDLSNKDFFKQMISIKGIGPATANYLCNMYWKFNSYNIDSYVKRRCKEIWGIKEDEIECFLMERYKNLEPYATLILWLEITRHWHSKRVSSKNWKW